jgi:hypothetical protein
MSSKGTLLAVSQSKMPPSTGCVEGETPWMGVPRVARPQVVSQVRSV